MAENFTSKDVEGVLEAMIYKVDVKKHFPLYDIEKIYYVLQGPRYWMDRLIYANVNRPRVAISCDKLDPDKTSWVYFSNEPEVPNSFILNIHYGSLKSTQSSNRLGQVKFDIPDFGKVTIENKEDTCYSSPDSDKVNYILKKSDI